MYFTAKTATPVQIATHDRAEGNKLHTKKQHQGAGNGIAQAEGLCSTNHNYPTHGVERESTPVSLFPLQGLVFLWCAFMSSMIVFVLVA